MKQESMVTGKCGGSRHHEDFDPVKARRVLDQSRRMICMQPPRGPNWRGLWAKHHGSGPSYKSFGFFHRPAGR